MNNDLISFLDQLTLLNKTLQGQALFSNIEDNLSLRMSADELGHIIVQGIIRHPVQYNLQTSFEYECDQTFLSLMIQEINDILKYTWKRI